MNILQQKQKLPITNKPGIVPRKKTKKTNQEQSFQTARAAMHQTQTSLELPQTSSHMARSFVQIVASPEYGCQNCSYSKITLQRKTHVGDILQLERYIHPTMREITWGYDLFSSVNSTQDNMQQSAAPAASKEVEYIND